MWGCKKCVWLLYTRGHLRGKGAVGLTFFASEHRYQRDIPEKALTKRLDAVVEDCVSQVGVELNSAHEMLLRRVPGLNLKRARAIIQHRDGGCKSIARYHCGCA